MGKAAGIVTRPIEQFAHRLRRVREAGAVMDEHEFSQAPWGL